MKYVASPPHRWTMIFAIVFLPRPVELCCCVAALTELWEVQEHLLGYRFSIEPALVQAIFSRAQADRGKVSA